MDLFTFSILLFFLPTLFGHVYYSQKPKRLIRGKFCVYNSECDECSFGLSRWCKSNTCMCQDNSNPLHKQIFLMNGYSSTKPSHESNCHPKNDFYALTSYYDTASNTCIHQPIIETSYVENCDNHMVLVSRVDGRAYCASQISVYDILCNENRDCDGRFSNDFLPWCRGGYCHAIHTTNRTRTIQSFSHCDSNVLTYCKEKSYTYTPISPDRIIKCQKECFNSQSTYGIPLSWLNGCFCLSYLESPSAFIRGYSETDLSKNSLRYQRYQILSISSFDRFERERPAREL